MGKQEKAAKKAKQAEAEAAAIIEEAARKAKARASLPFADERKEGVTDEEFEIGVRVRQLRDENTPWWKIARDLDMEGSGDSATTGKKGAARARSAYAKAFGSHPRTFRTGVYKGPVERNANVAALKAATRIEMKRKALKGKSVISPKLSDQELAEMLKGRKIKWIIKGDHCPDGMEMEAAIHPQTPLYITGEGKKRVIEFREREPRAPIKFRMIPSRIRTVRVSRIFSVK